MTTMGISPGNWQPSTAPMIPTVEARAVSKRRCCIRATSVLQERAAEAESLCKPDAAAFCATPAMNCKDKPRCQLAADSPSPLHSQAILTGYKSRVSERWRFADEQVFTPAIEVC
jgi:hypothetical protein